MAGIDIQKFVGGAIGAVIVVLIVVTVAVPVISDNLLPTTGEGTIENAGAINSMLEVIPLLLVVAIILAIVGMFLYKKAN